MMKRKHFIEKSLIAAAIFPFIKIQAMLNLEISPEVYYFKDDGIIPNSRYPLLLYKNAFSKKGNEGAEWLEAQFKNNNWFNSWRWGIYPFHHYHSNTHEVLGCYQGTAEIHLGGPQGKKFNISAGDIIVIPAGVGHKCISHSQDFTVVGAYPNGMEWDLVKEEKNKYEQSLANIKKVPLPDQDPLEGRNNGLINIWKK